MAGTSKRFLGLGFTFSATDNGLEKKLQGIKSLMTDINALSAGISFGNGPARTRTQRQQRTTGGNTGGQTRTQASLLPKNSQTKSTTAVGGKKLSDDVKFIDKLRADYSELFSGSKQAHFLAEFDNLRDHALKTGSTIGVFSKAVGLMGSSFAETESSATSFTKRITFFVGEIFSSIWEYAQRVGTSVNHFLKDLGLDLNSVIPREIQSAFGVITTALSPITSKFSSMLGGLFGKKDDNKGIITAIKKMNQVVGMSLTKPSLQESLDESENLLRAANGKDKGGFLDKIKNFLGKLPLIGSVLTGLGFLTNLLKPLGDIAGAILNPFKGFFKTLWGYGVRMIKGLFSKETWGFVWNVIRSPLQSLGTGLRWLWTGISNVGTILRTIFMTDLPALFGMVGNSIMGLIAGFAEVIAIIAIVVTVVTAAAGFIWGFIKTIPEIVSGLWEMIKGVGSVLSAIGGYVVAWFEATFPNAAKYINEYLIQPLVTFASSVGDAIKFIWDGIKTFLSGVFNFFEKIGSFIGGGLADLFKTSASGYKQLAETINQATDNIKKDQAAKVSTPAGQVVPVNIPGAVINMKDSVMAQQATAENSSTQVDLMKTQNDILLEISSSLSKGAGMGGGKTTINNNNFGGGARGFNNNVMKTLSTGEELPQ